MSSSPERLLPRRRRRDTVAPPPLLTAVAPPSPQDQRRRRSITMPDSSGATVLDDLPEAMIQEILVRLAPKDVLRCRAVRKSWRSAASTRKFMLDHHGLRPSLPAIDALNINSRLVLTLRDGAGAAGASSQKLRPFLRWTGCSVLLHTVCDGLLLISKHSTISICNPATRTCARLPLPPVRSGFCPDAVGFYRNRSGEYRVLYLVRRFSSDYDYHAASFYVLSEGSDQPSRIGWPTVWPASVKRASIKALVRSFSLPPVHHRGSLHWLREHGTAADGDILVFDTEAETFRSMCLPATGLDLWHVSLFDMDGTVVLSCSGTISEGGTIDIWVMQD